MMARGFMRGKKRPVGHLTRVATSLALLLLLTLFGLFFGVSYANSITPAGIVIHHSALPPLPDGRAVDVKTIDQIHRERGFGAFYWGRSYYVGYHYVILPDGTVQTGRPEHCRGAHATGFNSYLGICLVGDFSSEDNPAGARGAKEPTEAQMRSLIELTTQLRARYAIPLGNVIQHHDVNPNTACPGDRFPFSQFIEQLRERDEVGAH